MPTRPHVVWHVTVNDFVTAIISCLRSITISINGSVFATQDSRRGTNSWLVSRFYRLYATECFSLEDHTRFITVIFGFLCLDSIRHETIKAFIQKHATVCIVLLLLLLTDTNTKYLVPLSSEIIVSMRSADYECFVSNQFWLRDWSQRHKDNSSSYVIRIVDWTEVINERMTADADYDCFYSIDRLIFACDSTDERWFTISLLFCALLHTFLLKRKLVNDMWMLWPLERCDYWSSRYSVHSVGRTVFLHGCKSVNRLFVKYYIDARAYWLCAQETIVLENHLIRPLDQIVFYRMEPVRKLLAVCCRDGSNRHSDGRHQMAQQSSSYYVIPINHCGPFSYIDRRSTLSQVTSLSELDSFPVRIAYAGCGSSSEAEDRVLPVDQTLTVERIIDDQTVLAAKMFGMDAVGRGFHLPIRTQLLVDVVKRYQTVRYLWHTGLE